MSSPGDFLTAFAQALSALSLYPDGHASRERALDTTYGKLADLLSEDRSPFFSFLENEVIYRNTPLREMRNWDWSARFAGIGMQRLEFNDTVSRDELERFIEDTIGRLSASYFDSSEGSLINDNCMSSPTTIRNRR